MRPIDADALSGRMYHDAFETDSDMQKWDSGCWIRYKMFENAIAEAPTITPERKKGRWIKVHWKAFRCSECNRINEYFTDYCPNCGSYNGGDQ